jgi:fatty acid desaturase
VNEKMSKKERTLKSLYTYIFFGGIYLLGAVIWFVISYFRRELDSPVTLLWLVGAVIYIIMMVVSARRAAKLKSGATSVAALQPDERNEYIAGKTAEATVWLGCLILLAYIGGETGSSGKVPIDAGIFLLVVVVIYFGLYIYYQRKY